MFAMIVRPFAFVLVLMLAAGSPAAAEQQNPQPQAQDDAQDRPTFEEQVVVSASRVEQQLVNAPAAVSVVTAETIENSPATNIGDLLRAVPGVNVAQVSARDVNITSRGSTGTLSTSQLALVDGRSVYLDFFGMVMWDLIPTNPNDIKQIEVIRGPASAVWGANAMSGVVNVITKSPRELAAQGGSALTIGIGTFDRDTAAAGERTAGSLFYVNGSHAEAVNDRWAFKLSAGYFTQDPLPRPVGVIPNAARTPYPAYQNEGTSQPKFDARVDYDLAAGGTITVGGGVAGTEGIIHSGIGPFDISSDSRMSYLTARYQKGARRVAFFTNLLNGNADNLLARGPTGLPLPLDFNTKTFDVDASDLRTIGTRHAVSYGGNYRRNTFQISLAPNGGDRNEGGGYIQDEVFLTDRVRMVLGGRLDKFSSIGDVVFSPRTTLLLKPAAAQTVRLSFNRAFRAPSYINNNISTTILNEVNLRAIGGPAQYVFPLRAVGNPDLKQETMTAFELGYTGSIRNRATVSAAVYWNHTDDGIYFTQVGSYTAASPPPGFPLPPVILGILANLNPPVVLPSLFTYRNLGSVNDKGIELGVDGSLNRYVNVYTNYSYQWEPTVEGFPISEINLPPNHRVNAGFNFSYARVLGNLSVSRTSDAFWQDVLDARFAGRTEAYTLVNLGAGVRWAGGKVVTSLKITNLANEEIMQHVFGDVLRRQVIGEVRFGF
jgi:iron complex outermembrane receptor protein